MSNQNIFGVEQALAIVAADGYRVEIINSHTYSSAEQTLLNGAEIRSLALGKIGTVEGVWQKVTSTNTPASDYKRLATADELSTAIADAVATLNASISATNASLAATDATVGSHSTRIAALEEEVAPLQLEVGVLNQFKTDELVRQSLQDDRLEQLEICCADKTPRVEDLEDNLSATNSNLRDLTDRVGRIESQLSAVNESFSVVVTGTTPVELFEISNMENTCVEFTYTADKNDSGQTTYATTRGFVAVLLPHPSATGVSPAVAQEQMMKLGVSMPPLVFSTEKVGSAYKIKVAATAASNQMVSGAIRLRIAR